MSKSPSVRHLDRFSFFPRARLLILVRDGRAVVRSAMDTFGWEFDGACRAWADPARRFQQIESHRANRWRLMRYEDLVDDVAGELRAIFEWLELDATRYDFEAAHNLPVRGSSAFGRDGHTVHWEAVAKDDTARRALYRTRVRLALRSRIANNLRSLRIRPAGR